MFIKLMKHISLLVCIVLYISSLFNGLYLNQYDKATFELLLAYTLYNGIVE